MRCGPTKAIHERACGALGALVALAVAGCPQDGRLSSPHYRRPAPASCWQLYHPAQAVRLTPDLLAKDAVLLAYDSYVAIYDPNADRAVTCKVPENLYLCVQWPHAWWLESEPVEDAAAWDGSTRLFCEGFYEDLRTGRRQRLTDFDMAFVTTFGPLPDQGLNPLGSFCGDRFVTWDPKRQRYRQLDGTSGEWTALPATDSLPPGKAVLRCEFTDTGAYRIVLGPTVFCIMIPGASDAIAAFAFAPGAKQWTLAQPRPEDSARRIIWGRSYGVGQTVTVGGRHYAWRDPPFGPLRTDSGVDFATFVHSSAGRLIPVTEDNPPMHLMPPGLQPDRASPEEVQAVRNLLPSEFDRTHAVLSSACSDSKIWVIFHDLSVRPRVHEPVPSLRFSPSDSAVADLGTGKVTFLKPSDLQPMGHPIEPIGIWNEYLFACEFVRAGPGRGSPCITFVVIRNPAGRWGRVESLSGERFAVKGDWAFALLPASETYPWLHRARVAEVVKTVFPDNDGGTKGK